METVQEEEQEMDTEKDEDGAEVNTTTDDGPESKRVKKREGI